MNQLFDAGRWWLLVGKHWSENRKKYTLSLVAIAGLLFLWLAIIVVSDRGNIGSQVQIGTYYTGLFLVGCLYSSMLFADLGSKTRGLNYLTLPASLAEKLLCNLFYGVVVFLVCYTAMFYTIDFIMVKAGNAIALSRWVKYHTAGDVFMPEKVFNAFETPQRHSEEPNLLFYIMLFYFVLQAAFMLGSVYFARFSFIKTIIALILVGLSGAFLVGNVITHILPPGNYYHGITSYQLFTVKDAPSARGIMIYSDPATDKLVTLPSWIGSVLLFLLKFTFAPLLWLSTYFRLKEKEI